jgi:hypothetical protein
VALRVVVAGLAQLRKAVAYSAAWAGVSLPETRSSAGPLVKVYSLPSSGALFSSCASRCWRIVALLASAKTSTDPPFWMLPGRTPAVSAGLIRLSVKVASDLTRAIVRWRSGERGCDLRFR